MRPRSPGLREGKLAELVSSRELPSVLSADCLWAKKKGRVIRKGVYSDFVVDGIRNLIKLEKDGLDTKLKSRTGLGNLAEGLTYRRASVV